MSEERRLPPVTEVGMASLALIVAGGIYLSAHLPREVPLTPAVASAPLVASRHVGKRFSLSAIKLPGYGWILKKL